MIRISASDLESFRYWRANEEASLADLVSRLTHKDPPTPQMEAGRAFAKLMETAREEEIAERTVDGWTFRFELDRDTTIALPPVRELKAETVFETPHGLVTLVTKCDGVEGVTVGDQKLTERFDAERYLDSLQWRAYLVAFGARRFIYDVFVGRYDGRVVTVHEYHRLPFYSYPEMRRDVETAVRELVEVIAEHIPEKVTA